MENSEFDLIQRYFNAQALSRSDVSLGIGDDCALLDVPEGMQLAISTDSLVAGTHFLADADPESVAHKALASNLSDLAAMGAEPAWVSLALTLPTPDLVWLEGFCRGFFALAQQHNIQLIGGDTTKGPLSLTLTVQGFVPKGKALLRSGGKVGDGIYVTGTLGDSAAGLACILDAQPTQPLDLVDRLIKRHYYAIPRICTGIGLRGIASAALDISDGIMSDLGHILSRSGVGASIDINQLPLSCDVLDFCRDKIQAQQFALTSGEEYELCFTVPMEKEAQLQLLIASDNVEVTRIGQLTDQSGITLWDGDKPLHWQLHGYDHFLE